MGFLVAQTNTTPIPHCFHLIKSAKCILQGLPSRQTGHLDACTGDTTLPADANTDADKGMGDTDVEWLPMYLEISTCGKVLDAKVEAHLFSIGGHAILAPYLQFPAYACVSSRYRLERRGGTAALIGITDEHGPRSQGW